MSLELGEHALFEVIVLMRPMRCNSALKKCRCPRDSETVSRGMARQPDLEDIHVSQPVLCEEPSENICKHSGALKENKHTSL